MVKDLWDPKLNTWNIQLVNYLFTPHADHAILQTAIVNVIGQDVLVWKLTSTDDCTFGGVSDNTASIICHYKQIKDLSLFHCMLLISSQVGMEKETHAAKSPNFCM